MSLTQSEVRTADFIDSTEPLKIDGRTVAKKAYKMAVTRYSTMHTLWLLAVKHKIALLTIGNVILVLNWALPEWPQMLLNIVK